MPRVLNFYMDDSGTRKPNRKPLAFDPANPNFFALGGILINEEDEAAARKSYADFCERWQIDYPLHSVEMRHSSDNFSWLKRGTKTYVKFMRDLTALLTVMPVLGLACVIDRPGYDDRYRAKYGRRQWQLCQTAFSIAVERATKFARRDGRKLRVMPEMSTRDDERRLKNYYASLKANGCPFEHHKSAGYGPLMAAEFAETLYELRFKSKTSPMGQIADLFLWPIATAGYDDTYLPYRIFRDAGRLIESQLKAEEVEAGGSKYSRFELVAKHKRNA